jgi:hypothetical protein
MLTPLDHRRRHFFLILLSCLFFLAAGFTLGMTAAINGSADESPAAVCYGCTCGCNCICRPTFDDTCLVTDRAGEHYLLEADKDGRPSWRKLSAEEFMANWGAVRPEPKKKEDR